MSLCECRCTCKCSIIAVIVSIALGVIAAFLNFSMTLTIPVTVLWIFIAAALLFLAFSLLIAPFIRKKDATECLCSSLTTFLAGIFGTVLLSLVLILADIAATGLLASVITGILIASFFLIVTSAACLVKELFNCDC